MAVLAPFQLLEINIISAQDLAPVAKKMRTYATAWVHPNRKLSTRVDAHGHNNPTWNDKFVFRVDDEFLRSDTSAVMIEIHAVHWFRDTHVGTVRVLVGNLIPPPVRHSLSGSHHHPLGMRFVALQVRRPSGRPQGILNIGVALLDSSMRSMPLYTQLSASAVGYRDLMGEEDPHHHHHHHNNNANNHYHNTNQNANNPPIVKPILRRSKSERSERVTFDDISNNGSMINVPQGALDFGKAGSMISGSDFVDPPKKTKRKKGKASSVISGAELREKKKDEGRKGKASSVISGGSELRAQQPKDKAQRDKPILIVDVPRLLDIPPPKPKEKEKVVSEKAVSEISDLPRLQPPPPPPPNMVVAEKPIGKANGPVAKVTPSPAVGKLISKFNGYDYGPTKGPAYGNGNKFLFGGPQKANSIWSDSEVGPSPSEVAAAMAVERYPLDDNGSSILDGWSLDESVEGLRSKLERWRTELPPLYDRGYSMSSFRSTSQHARRHTEGSTGLFSCFGNIYGYECQCICGKPTSGRRNQSGHFQSPGASVGRSFL